jgi:hypothetical protein
MVLILLEILGYWIAMAGFMAMLMISALAFAKVCELILDIVLNK